MAASDLPGEGAHRTQPIPVKPPAGKRHTGRPGRAAAIATAGGLLFIAATDDNRFRALEASTGRELWADRLDQRGNADPMTFLGADGRQYVVIAATDTIVAYARPYERNTGYVMPNVTVTRRIDASADVVFRTVAHGEQFSQAVPGILRIEFLSEVKSGVGARFRETRTMMGQEASTELEVTEYVENQRVRMVSEAGGAFWDTVFTTAPDGEGTVLEMVMDAQPRTTSARMTLPLIIGAVRKAVEQDLDAIKAFCERPEQQ